MIQKKTAYDISIKSVENTEGRMTFSGYANTKNYVDHANDSVAEGAYSKAIERSKDKGKMPKLLWSHDLTSMPVGVITSMREDEKGLFIEGELADTPEGLKLYKLMKMGAIDSFSIGYSVQEEKWDKTKKINFLIKIDVKEVSFVNLPCNDESLLQEVKSRIDNNELPTRRELQDLLRQHCGFSKRLAEKTMQQFIDSPTDQESAKASIDKILSKINTL